MANFFDGDLSKYTGGGNTQSSDQSTSAATTPAVTAPNFFDSDIAKYTNPSADTPTTATGIAKNVAAATAEDIPAGLINFATDPGGTLLRLPVVAGGTAYDALAHATGWFPPMSPELRNTLYGLPEPGQPASTDDVGIGTRVMSAIDKMVLPPDRSATTLPATPIESAARRFVGAAGTVATLGPGGFLAPAVAGTTAAITPAVTDQVPDWLKPGTDLALNTIPQLALGAFNLNRGSSSVDPADAATVKMAGDQGVNFNATDITPGSQYRTPASAQSGLDDWEGLIVKSLGEDPNTPDLLSRNRVTPTVMGNTATSAGDVFNDVASRTNISPQETNGIITKLANIDGNLDLENLTDAQKATIRRNIDLVQNAAAKGNGTISGSDYQTLTRTGTPIDRLAGNSDPNVAAIGMQIKHAIDDGFQASATPEDQAALTQVRQQWRLMKTVQPLVAEAQGANIDPGKFVTRAVAASQKLDGSTGGMAYTGGGQIGDLTRMASVLRRAPTPVQPSVMRDLSTPAVGTALLAEHHPALAAGLQAGKAVWNQLAGAYMRSNFNTQSVINNALYQPSFLNRVNTGNISSALANQFAPQQQPIPEITVRPQPQP